MISQSVDMVGFSATNFADAAISYKTWRTDNLRQHPYQCDMLISISTRHPSRML